MTLSAWFLLIWKMSLTAAVAVLLIWPVSILLHRLKTPAALRYLLWFVVLFRLLCPYSFSAEVSLFQWTPLERGLQAAEQLPQTIPSSRPPQTIVLEPGLPDGQSQPATPVVLSPTTTTLADGLSSPLPAAAPAQATPGLTPGGSQPLRLISGLWLAGVVGLLLYSAIRYGRFRRSLSTAVRLDDDIYTCENQAAPFVCGFARPRIYLPLNLGAEEAAYIIQHERVHLRRMDHWWKLIWFLACCLHWFNPLAWLAFYEMNKNMEMSCDEAVLREYGPEIKVNYSQSLLAVAAPCHWLAGNPLAFGEIKTKERIQNVLRYQKPLLGGILAAIAVVLTLSLILIANPREPEPYEAPLLRYPHILSASITRPGQGYYPERIVFAEPEELDRLGELLLSGKQLNTIPEEQPLVANFLQAYLVNTETAYTYYVYGLEGRYFVEQPGEVAYEIDLETYNEIYTGFHGTSRSVTYAQPVYLQHYFQEQEELAADYLYLSRQLVGSHLLVDDDHPDILAHMQDSLDNAADTLPGLNLEKVSSLYSFRSERYDSGANGRLFQVQYHVYEAGGDYYIQRGDPEDGIAQWVSGYQSRRREITAEQYAYVAELFGEEDRWRPALIRLNISLGSQTHDVAAKVLRPSYAEQPRAQSYSWLNDTTYERGPNNNELYRSDDYLLLQEEQHYLQDQGYYESAYCGLLLGRPYLFEAVAADGVVYAFLAVNLVPYRLTDGTLWVEEVETAILAISRSTGTNDYGWSYSLPDNAAALNSIVPLTATPDRDIVQEMLAYRDDNEERRQLEEGKWDILTELLADYSIQDSGLAYWPSYHRSDLFHY